MQQQFDARQLFFDDHQAFYDPFYPFKPLDNYHALHYFEHSPFFDRNSNNSTARHDLQDINRPEVQWYAAQAGSEARTCLGRWQ